MKLPSFVSIVRKCLEVEVKTGVEQDKIHDVILLSFDQIDDATKVSLIMAGLNDGVINNIIAKEQFNISNSAIESVNQIELLKWRTWVMKVLIITGCLIVAGVIFAYIMLPSGCDQDAATSVLMEIKKYIDLLVFNKVN